MLVTHSFLVAFNNLYGQDLYGQDLYGQDLYGVSKISKVVDTNFKIFKCLNSKFKKTCLLPPSKLRENHDERFFVYAKWRRWRLKKTPPSENRKKWPQNH